MVTKTWRIKVDAEDPDDSREPRERALGKVYIALEDEGLMATAEPVLTREEGGADVHIDYRLDFVYLATVECEPARAPATEGG